MTVNLVKSRTVFFPDIPREIGKQPAIYQHFQEIEEEMTKQTMGLFDNDAVLRDALNTAVTVQVTAAGDIPIATGSDWGVLAIGNTNEIMFVSGTQPAWTTPATLGIPAITAATTGAMIYFAGTTGWMHIASGSENQHFVYKTDSGRGVWTTWGGPSSAPTTDGQIIFSTASAWTSLAPGSSGQVLTMNATTPQWSAPSVGGYLSRWAALTSVSALFTGATGTVSVAGLNATGIYRGEIRARYGGGDVGHAINVYVNTLNNDNSYLRYFTHTGDIATPEYTSANSITMFQVLGGDSSGTDQYYDHTIFQFTIYPGYQLNTQPRTVFIGTGAMWGAQLGTQPNLVHDFVHLCEFSGSASTLYVIGTFGTSTGTSVVSVILDTLVA